MARSPCCCRRRCCVLALLCVSVVILCATRGVQSQTRKKQRTTVDVVATVAIMQVAARDGASGRRRGNAFVELRCPEVRDPIDGFLKTDPDCNVPVKRIVKGSKEVAAFQEQYQLVSGDTVAATFDLRPRNSSSRRALLADVTAVEPILRPGSIRVLERGEQKEVFTGTPIALKGVVYLMDYCGWKNPFRSAEEFKQYLFANALNATEGNMQNHYRTCSFGKTTFDPDNIAVVGPIEADCRGMVYTGVMGYPFDGNSGCGAAEHLHWIRTGDAMAQNLSSSDPVLKAALQATPRRRVIVILPREAPCGWAGLADVYCVSPTCRTFIKTYTYDRAQIYPVDVHTMFHELQHNHGLGHANGNGVTYEDNTDPMGTSPGASQGVHCHNAPYSYKLGWATPVPGGELTAGSFTPAANRLNLTIPASGTTDKNMVILHMGAQSSEPGGLFISYPKYFLSYRVRNMTFGGYDSALSSTFNQRVLIHNYNGTIGDRDFNTSNYLAACSAGRNWTAPFVAYNSSTGLGGGLRVRAVSVGPTSAVVEVCRMFAQREGTPGSAECAAKQDRDCDGLVGSADPDCRQAVSG